MRAKANVKQTVVQDEDGNLAIQTKVKFQFRLIQQDVSSGLSPLAGSESESDALLAFGQELESLASQFGEEGTIDADELIASVLDAFNELYRTFAGESSPPSVDGDVVDAESVQVRSENATETLPPSAALPPVESNPIEPVETDEAEAVVLVENPAQPGPIDESEVAPSVAEVQGETAGPAIDAENNTLAETPVGNEATEAVDRRAVLQQVRLQFVQSISQTIRTLTPDGETGPGLTVLQQQSSLRFSASLSYLA